MGSEIQEFRSSQKEIYRRVPPVQPESPGRHENPQIITDGSAVRLGVSSLARVEFLPLEKPSRYYCACFSLPQSLVQWRIKTPPTSTRTRRTAPGSTSASTISRSGWVAPMARCSMRIYQLAFATTHRTSGERRTFDTFKDVPRGGGGGRGRPPPPH